MVHNTVRSKARLIQNINHRRQEFLSVSLQQPLYLDLKKHQNCTIRGHDLWVSYLYLQCKQSTITQALNASQKSDGRCQNIMILNLLAFLILVTACQAGGNCVSTDFVGSRAVLLFAWVLTLVRVLLLRPPSMIERSSLSS